MRSVIGRLPAWLILLPLLALRVPAGAEEWPDLATPAEAVGGGEEDAAVVAGIEGYAFVPQVAGAEANAKAWYDYFTRTRGIPVGRVKLLTGVDATADEMRDAAKAAASLAGPKGTLWFVFIGHGAPAQDGKDGLLVAVDAQQKAKSLQRNSLRRGELLKALGETKAGAIRIVLDACFSGKREDGSSLAPGLQPLVAASMSGPADPRMVVLTAAKADQFAGALPGTQRPAFSYLVLGALRGWTGKAQVRAGDLWRYAGDALSATLRGRNQTPELSGPEDAAFGRAAGEKGPDLASLAKATAGAGASDEMFKVSSLPALPKAQAPSAMKGMAGAEDFRNIDVEGLKLLNEATLFDKGGAEAAGKASKWRELAKAAPQFVAKAEARAKEWEQYSGQIAATEKAMTARAEAWAKDWEKLRALLALEVVSDTDKKRWAISLLDAYGWEHSNATMIAPFIGQGSFTDYLAGRVQACKAGTAEACRVAGVILDIGLGVKKDEANAVEQWRRSCDLGSPKGCNSIGVMLFNGTGTLKDQGAAVRLYAKACSMGEPRACVNLGASYAAGTGVSEDKAKAVEFHRKACDSGSPVGCVALGWVFEAGEGVAMDKTKAAALYKKACDMGSLRGCRNLGVMHDNGHGVPEDKPKAVSLFRKACDAGEDDACISLGWMHERGRGVAKDEAAATNIYRKACENGHNRGCTYLGVMYDNGLGVAQDQPRAATLFRKSCDAGDSEGCADLGLMYEHGRGIGASVTEAVTLYRKACDQGNAQGCSFLGVMHDNGKGVTEDKAKAVELFQKACDKGSAHGCYSQGLMYEGGRGVTVDAAKARELYRKACGMGNQDACKRAP
ncbi:MAG: SEL1-like repeat protein [Elusimicrobia bacterium]|nr:SEL1-like repeat protein [Elusimicrobiota bacterium]